MKNTKEEQISNFIKGIDKSFQAVFDLVNHYKIKLHHWYGESPVIRDLIKTDYHTAEKFFIINSFSVPFDMHIKFIKMKFKKDYSKFYSTPYWSLIRNILVSEESKCELCNSKYNLHVHHKTYEHFGLEIFFKTDLIILCGKCHAKHHNK